VLDATDNRSLEAMADAAKAVLGKESFNAPFPAPTSQLN